MSVVVHVNFAASHSGETGKEERQAREKWGDERGDFKRQMQIIDTMRYFVIESKICPIMHQLTHETPKPNVQTHCAREAMMFVHLVSVAVYNILKI